MDKKYLQLLSKFSHDESLEELILFVRLDDLRLREEAWSTTGRYPDERDLLSKLKFDLETIKRMKVNDDGTN